MSRARKWLIIAVIVTFIIILFKAKAFAPAGLLSGILFLTSLVERIYRIRAAKKAYDSSQQGQGASHTKLPKRDALDMFDLHEPYTKAQVNVAYKRLMQQNHPDKGGSKFIASEINQARDILLKGLK